MARSSRNKSNNRGSGRAPQGGRFAGRHPGRQPGRTSGRQQEQISRRHGDDDLATVLGDLPPTPSSPNDGTVNTQSSNDGSDTPLLAHRSSKGTRSGHHDSADDQQQITPQGQAPSDSSRPANQAATAPQDYRYTLLTPNTEGINSDVVRAVEDTEQKLDEATRLMGIQETDGGGKYKFVKKLFPPRPSSQSKESLPDERPKKDKKKGIRGMPRELRALLSPTSIDKKKKGEEPHRPRLSRSGNDGWTRQEPTIAELPSKEVREPTIVKLPSEEATLNLLGHESNPPTSTEAVANHHSPPIDNSAPSTSRVIDNTANTADLGSTDLERGTPMTSEPQQRNTNHAESSVATQGGSAHSKASSSTSTIPHSNETGGATTNEVVQDRSYAMSLAEVEAYEKDHGYVYETIEPTSAEQDHDQQGASTSKACGESESPSNDTFITM